VKILTTIDQANDNFENTNNKAMASRDKKAVKAIEKLENEYKRKRARLENEANKTMDPKLRKEWIHAQKEYSDVWTKILLEMDK